MRVCGACIGIFFIYVQKHIAHLAACSGLPAGSRRGARGARIYETHLLALKNDSANSFDLSLEIATQFS